MRPRHAAPGSVRFRRRGGVYILVLGCATLIAVVGLGAIAVSRTEIRSTRAASDWARAGALAQAGVESAIAIMNTSDTWRIDHATGDEKSIGPLAAAGPATVGAPGEASFRIVDPADGDLEKSDRDAVTVHGYGRVGDAVRVFSIDCQYRPPPVLDVLKYGLYSTGAITTGNASVLNGPLGAPSLSVNGVLTSDVRVGTLSNSGSIIGEVRTGESALLTRSNGDPTALRSLATTISYAAIGGDRIEKCLLSPSSNPYGSLNSEGLYFISVPATKLFKVQNARVVGTLIVELGISATLEVHGPINWDRASTDHPTIIAYSAGEATVRFDGTGGDLQESSVNINMNPPSAPYQGSSDADQLDVYTSEVRGVVHVLGSAVSTSFIHAASVVGAVICEGSVLIKEDSKITSDAQLLQNPPLLYQTAPAGMEPVPGSWRWRVIP